MSQQIVIQQELINRGLNVDILQKALAIDNRELADHNFEFRMEFEYKSKKNKQRRYWFMRVYLDNSSQGVIVGMSGYHQQIIVDTINSLRDAALSGKKPKGVWPQRGCFLQWLKLRIHNSESKKKTILVQKSFIPKKLNQCQTPEQLLTFILKRIKKLQKEHAKVINRDYRSVLTFWEQYWDQLTPEQQQTVKEHRQYLDFYLGFCMTDFNDGAHYGRKEGDYLLVQDSSATTIIAVDINDSKILYQERELKFAEIGNKHSLLQKWQQQFIREQKNKRFYETIEQLPSQLLEKIRALQSQALQSPDKMAFAMDKQRHFITNFDSTKLQVDHYLEIDINWITSCIHHVEHTLLLTFDKLKLRAILGLIASTPKYGTTTYAMWLGKSQAKSLQQKSLDKEFRGMLSVYTIAAIVEQIEKLRTDKLLEVFSIGKHDLPVLRLTETGKNKLKSLKKTPRRINTPSLEKTPKIIEPPLSSSTYQRLLTAITEERRMAWVEFLNTVADIEEMVHWSNTEIDKIRYLLNEKMAGWDTLVRWQLVKHPRKYKIFERLLGANQTDVD